MTTHNIYIYIYIHTYNAISYATTYMTASRVCPDHLHSAKGGAVERGCSALYDVIHDFTI